MELPCSCCIPSTLLFVVGLTWIVLKLVDTFILSSILPKFKTAKKVYVFLSWSFTVLVGLVAVGFGIIANNPQLKDYVFFKFAMLVLTKDSPFTEARCEHLRNVSGRVLELGPGPGTNFRCFENNTKITEWVGVEPNVLFHPVLDMEKNKYNLPFPIRTIGIKGENLEIEPYSFDSVVGTHVLCSVDDTTLVLKQVSRALKSNGNYFFLEHVSAPLHSSLYYLQRVTEPIFNIIGNGCLFKSTWLDLTAETGLAGFDVDLTFIDAPMPIPMVVPHVIGVARKQ